MVRRILHIDADSSIRMVTRIALVDVSGFELLSCDSGKRALKNIGVFKPQLVLMDVRLSDINGFDLLNNLNELPCMHKTPIVFMTAITHETEMQRYLSAGVNAVIKKPFDPIELGRELVEIYNEYYTSYAY